MEKMTSGKRKKLYYSGHWAKTKNVKAREEQMATKSSRTTWV